MRLNDLNPINLSLVDTTAQDGFIRGPAVEVVKSERWTAAAGLVLELELWPWSTDVSWNPPFFRKKPSEEMDPTEMEQADDEFSVERVLDKRVRFFKCPNMETDC